MNDANKRDDFEKWLIRNGFQKESEERYTLSRTYLYELYLREKPQMNGKKSLKDYAYKLYDNGNIQKEVIEIKDLNKLIIKYKKFQEFKK